VGQPTGTREADSEGEHRRLHFIIDFSNTKFSFYSLILSETVCQLGPARLSGPIPRRPLPSAAPSRETHMEPKTWRLTLKTKIRPDWAAEIDAYEQKLLLKREGRLDDKVFAETRLRRGAYGQRYDNGKRHNGIESQSLGYDPTQTKGPDTLWDAPGMQRIKIPGGRVSIRQLEVLCDLAEEYSDEILHVTTRQDIQLHYVH